MDLDQEMDGGTGGGGGSSLNSTLTGPHLTYPDTVFTMYVRVPCHITSPGTPYKSPVCLQYFHSLIELRGVSEASVNNRKQVIQSHVRHGRLT